ncbi:MAG TPA: AMP-binding protein, partial [Streptosporangiaceae bacterium]|nr:AMP-binding protein [Streptosporangiaceae bacterium]
MDLTIPAAVRRAAREFGDATAIAEPGGPRLSYRDLHERTNIVTRALVAGGIEPGDRVAIWSPNTHHWVLAALGALGAGATLVPVNTRYTGPEALDVISRSRARGLIVAGPFLGADRLAMLIAAAADQTDADQTDADQTGAPNVSARRAALPELIVRVPVQAATPAATNPSTGTAPARHA